ncbi:MAG: uracil-DNA glycosylase [gamma proteobacterium symbiont of Bathyaustriella thionipta]|nr:uracil-DNA glycosylase [gamma proteobacterium symbiont of Bathyaustriella thionipta]
MSSKADCFDLNCTACPRLAAFLADIRQQKPDYHARPVAAFGAQQANLLIVGLAPGMHGANRTGRPFTGDFAGILLYETLYKNGWASAPESLSADDGLQLIHCRITNAVKCLPPENKPSGDEINRCNTFLQAELSALKPHSVVLALGTIAHRAVIKALQLKQKDYAFAHGAQFALPGERHLIDSYHCSRYNTQTKRLTVQQFQDVFDAIRKLTH